MPSKKLEERVPLFQNGQWSQLLERRLSNDEQPTTCPHEGVDTRRTALRREQNEPEILSTSESCRQPESHSKEHRWLQAHWRH